MPGDVNIPPSSGEPVYGPAPTNARKIAKSVVPLRGSGHLRHSTGSSTPVSSTPPANVNTDKVKRASQENPYALIPQDNPYGEMPQVSKSTPAPAVSNLPKPLVKPLVTNRPADESHYVDLGQFKGKMGETTPGTQAAHAAAVAKDAFPKAGASEKQDAKSAYKEKEAAAKKRWEVAEELANSLGNIESRLAAAHAKIRFYDLPVAYLRYKRQVEDKKYEEPNTESINIALGKVGKAESEAFQTIADFYAGRASEAHQAVKDSKGNSQAVAQYQNEVEKRDNIKNLIASGKVLTRDELHALTRQALHEAPIQTFTSGKTSAKNKSLEETLSIYRERFKQYGEALKDVVAKRVVGSQAKETVAYAKQLIESWRGFQKEIHEQGSQDDKYSVFYVESEGLQSWPGGFDHLIERATKAIRPNPPPKPG